MRLHFLQHVSFEGPGYITEWGSKFGAACSSTRFFEGDSLPALGDLDLLVVLGGPMSVHDEALLPWLRAEKAFIKLAIDSGCRVLGICLGAQLIASSLGAQVYPAPQKEIGWFPVRKRNPGFEVFPGELSVFHWHGETFDLPRGSELLASSAACENQAFRLGERVLGLQFHLESTSETLLAMTENCGHELAVGAYIQSRDEILSPATGVLEENNKTMTKILGYLCSK